VTPRPPPPPERAPRTYATPHRAHEHAPTSDFEEAMMRINDFTEEMCRCADQSCTQQVMSEITTWGQSWTEQHNNFKPSEEENKQIQEVATTLMECLQHAGSNAPSP
jgi:hypothetical protein